jgi:predicted nucleic acid-binding protein
VIRTFVDTGVLIAAATGRHSDVLPHAIAVLDDDQRAFLSSPFVRLEVLPKAVHERRTAEVAFYEAYFTSVVDWADPRTLIDPAFTLAAHHGLNGMDALHAAAALALNADEFVTTERPTSPIFRIPTVRVWSIRPVAT